MERRYYKIEFSGMSKEKFCEELEKFTAPPPPSIDGEETHLTRDLFYRLLDGIKDTRKYEFRSTFLNLTRVNRHLLIIWTDSPSVISAHDNQMYYYKNREDWCDYKEFLDWFLTKYNKEFLIEFRSFLASK